MLLIILILSCLRSAKFGLLRNGEYIGVSALLNQHTKFAKLSVGKHVVTAKQRKGSKDPLLPLRIALSGLYPITKVEVSYEPQPKNLFTFRVNDEDLYSLTKEEVDFDPSKTESIEAELEVNEIRAFYGSFPWIIDEIEEKIQKALGMSQLSCLNVQQLHCKSWVANEFLDLLTCYDLPEQGLDKLRLKGFKSQCDPFEEEMVTRLVNMCPQISHLELSYMYQIEEEVRMSIVSLFRQIV